MKNYLVVISAFPKDDLIDSESIRMEKLLKESGIKGLEYVRAGRSLRMIIRCANLDTLLDKVEEIIPLFVDEILENYEVEIEELGDGEDSEGA